MINMKLSLSHRVKNFRVDSVARRHHWCRAHQCQTCRVFAWFETYAFGRVRNSAVKMLDDLAFLGIKDVALKPSEFQP